MLLNTEDSASLDEKLGSLEEVQSTIRFAGVLLGLCVVTLCEITLLDI